MFFFPRLSRGSVVTKHSEGQKSSRMEHKPEYPVWFVPGMDWLVSSIAIQPSHNPTWRTRGFSPVREVSCSFCFVPVRKATCSVLSQCKSHVHAELERSLTVNDATTSLRAKHFFKP